MKIIILLALLAGSVTADAQKLKDLLYGGKLKNDSGTVVRKSDDLTAKIDTNSKKRADSINLAKAKQAATVDSLQKKSESAADPAIVSDTEEEANVSSPRNNNTVWKEYMDSLTTTLKTELLPDRKIKKETYYVLVDYVIELDGQVTISNVVSSPENKYLQEQVKERLTLTVPRLSPVLLSNGKPRKVIRKYNFTLTKE